MMIKDMKKKSVCCYELMFNYLKLRSNKTVITNAKRSERVLMCRLERLNAESKVQYFPRTRPSDNWLARIRKLSAENI